MNRALLTTAVAAAMIGGWAFVLRKIGAGDVYAVLGPYALVVVVTSLILRRSLERTSQDKAETFLTMNVLVGAGLGVVMTIGTYAAYAVAERLLPSLRAQVAGLYAAAHTETVVAALAWTTVSIVAEELLFRGLLLESLRSAGAQKTVAALVSLAAYVLVQIGSGSWVIAAAALVCGAFWTVERVLTKSLVASIISHAIWTLVVIHVYPLVG
ncbi:MAG: CPBP family intramembrane glutamic endopeptidase [Polyangiaceae bacterium]